MTFAANGGRKKEDGRKGRRAWNRGPRTSDLAMRWLVLLVHAAIVVSGFQLSQQPTGKAASALVPRLPALPVSLRPATEEDGK